MTSAQPPIQYHRYSPESGWEPAEMRVIREATVSLTVNGEPWLSFACTPTQLEALAAGFLFNEGIIQKRDEIAVIDVCHQQTNVDVWLHHLVERPQNWRRTSGCTGGFTSTSSDESDPAFQTRPVQPRDGSIQPAALLAGMAQLLQEQELYRESGGVHCSIITDGAQVHLRAEDIGRHNTLDKLAGELLLGGQPISPIIILTTGRVSSEMLQKSSRMGAAAVASRTSPTSESVQLAERLGITLVGYARRNGFVVYAHPERLMLPQPPTGEPGPQPAETPPGC